jgi:hypothetical protein
LGGWCDNNRTGVFWEGGAKITVPVYFGRVVR